MARRWFAHASGVLVSLTRSVRIGLLVLATTACGDDGAGTSDDTGSGGTPGSTSTMTTTAPDPDSTGEAPSTSEGAQSESSGETGTTAGEGSSGTGSTGAGDATGTDTGSTGGDSTSAGACTAIPFTAVDEPGFTGQGFCEGVPQNAVLVDAQAVSDHSDQWCASVAACMFPEPPCDPVPALPADGEQIVYVFGTDSGCSGVATISEILDCGDTIEVHYVIGGIGMCGTIVNAWAAAAIPASDAEVVFVPG